MNILKLDNNDDFKVVRIRNNEFDQSSFVADASVMVFVHSGECELRVNVESYILKKNTVFNILPGDKVEFKKVTEKINASLLIIGKPMLGETLYRFEHYIMEAFFKHRLNLMSTGSDMTRFVLNVIDNVEITYNDRSNFYRYEQALSQLRSLMCYAADTVRHYAKKVDESNYSRLEEHFRNFMNTLTTHYKESREVSFYAKQMNVTPKYLNFISNQVANRTSKSMIDNYVILQLKTELRTTPKTVQEIAYEYNFPNQSFLGSYFKKFTGLSPRQFRNKSE